MDHLGSPPHMHGDHRSNRRSRDSRRSRRELRACPQTTRRRLDLFNALYEDTEWVHDQDIEQELASDANVDSHLTRNEQLTALGDDEFWETTRRRNEEQTARQNAMTDAAASSLTSAVPGVPAETSTAIKQELSTLPLADKHSNHPQDKHQTPHDEIKSIMTARRNKTQEDGNTDNTPSAPTTSSSGAAAGPSNQHKRKASGELEGEREEYTPQLMFNLDWFLKTQQNIGNANNIPGGSGSGSSAPHAAGANHGATAQKNLNAGNTPSSSSTLAGADTTTSATSQPRPDQTGETAQTEYNPQTMSLLDWFLKNKDQIGEHDTPGGTSGGAPGGDGNGRPSS